MGSMIFKGRGIFRLFLLLKCDNFSITVYLSFFVPYKRQLRGDILFFLLGLHIYKNELYLSIDTCNVTYSCLITDAQAYFFSKHKVL